MDRFREKFSIYKANKAGKGSAAQFDFNKEKKSIFLEMAPQLSTGEQAFNWNEKLILKLSLTDIAKLLTVLNGKNKTLDLFHDPTKSKEVQQKSLDAAPSDAKKNATLNFSQLDRGYYLKLSTQNQTGAVTSLAISISDDEAVTLKLLLEDAVRKSYDW